jgi:solute carrier family 25 carnitine/acylcarnitine transporter 20/29
LAGQIGWICSIVPDTLKSRLQISDSSASGRTIYREIIRSSGFRGLFAGVNVAIIRAFPANAALFVGYEYSRKFLDEVL